MGCFKIILFFIIFAFPLFALGLTINYLVSVCVEYDMYHKKPDRYHKIIYKMNYKGFIKVYNFVPNLFNIEIDSDNTIREIEYKGNILIVFNFINFLKARRYFKKINSNKKKQEKEQQKREKLEQKARDLQISLKVLNDMKEEIKEEALRNQEYYENKVKEIKQGMGQ